MSASARRKCLSGAHKAHHTKIHKNRKEATATLDDTVSIATDEFHESIENE